jgi:hypothetical protein
MKFFLILLILLFVLTFSMPAQSIYFDLGIGSRVGMGIKTGIGPISNLPIYFVGDLSTASLVRDNRDYGNGFLGLGAIFYPIQLIQLGLSLGYTPIIHKYGEKGSFGMSSSLAFDIGGRNYGILIGTKVFISVHGNLQISGSGLFIGFASRERVARKK